MKSIKKTRFAYALIQNVALGIVALVFASPIYIAIVNAFKETSLIQKSPLSFPMPPLVDNVARALSTPGVDVGRMYLNSITLVLCATSICILVSSLAAYYMARTVSVIGPKLRIYFLLGLMIPYVIVYLPLCIFVRKLGIPFDLPLLIMVFVSGNISFSTFMYTNYIRSLPADIEEAASIDGANKWQTFWLVLFPLLKPCTATVAIFVGLGVWNDFMTPLLIGQIQTITVGMYSAIGPHSADWGLVFSFVLFATVPVIVAYLCAQKQFISGLTSGAMKG